METREFVYKKHTTLTLGSGIDAYSPFHFKEYLYLSHPTTWLKITLLTPSEKYEEGDLPILQCRNRDIYPSRKEGSSTYIFDFTNHDDPVVEELREYTNSSTTLHEYFPEFICQETIWMSRLYNCWIRIPSYSFCESIVQEYWMCHESATDLPLISN